MSQEVVSQRRQSVNGPFRAKSAGVSLVVVLMIGMVTIANMLTLLPSDQAVPDGALSLIITTIALVVVVEVGLQIVLFIGAGRIEDRSERDNTIAAQASRNAYAVLTLGAFAAFGSMFAGFTPFEMGSLLLGAFLLAESVRFASQIGYYRRSA